MEAAAARRAAKAEAEPQAEQPATPASRKRGRVSEPASRTPSKRSKTTETSTPSRPPPRRGTRSSARFSTTEQDDSNWEQIPSDLQDRRDSDSDLSDPPEDDDAGDEKAALADASMDVEDASHQNGQEIEPKVEDEEQEKGEEEEKEEWIEFEAVSPSQPLSRACELHLLTLIWAHLVNRLLSPAPIGRPLHSVSPSPRTPTRRTFTILSTRSSYPW